MTTVLNYPIKSDFSLSNIPQELKELLDFAYREKYAELYEENHGNILLLKTVLLPNSDLGSLFPKSFALF